MMKLPDYPNVPPHAEAQVTQQAMQTHALGQVIAMVVG